MTWQLTKSLCGIAALAAVLVSFNVARCNHLFVNLDGELQVELLDDAGKVVATSTATAGDSTKQRVAWENGVDLSAWQGKPVRFRFRLASGSLYSFWLTPDAEGASNGYVAAGGPAFDSVRDAWPTKATAQ